MPVVLPEAPARLNRSASELGSTTTERLGAQFAGAFEDNPVPLVMRLNDLASANRRGNFIPRADAQRIAEQNGAMLDLPGDGVSSEALDIMIESALKRQRRQATIESAPQGMGVSAAGFVTELGAGLLDPAGFALNFVPVVGQSTRLALATNSARTATRLGARTAVGAIEGAVGQAMVEPLTGYTYRQEGREYGVADAATNIAFGTVLGSTAHNILGGGGDLWRTFRGEAHPWSLPGTIPLPPDVPVLPDATPDPMLGQGAIYGAQTKVKIGDAYQPARWAVVDAADVEATMEKADNQFRDRTRAASGAQIEAIARDIDFEYLNAHPDMASGAPTLSRDGKIIGGNGRAAAISMAYDLPSGMAYSGPMRERLTEWGVRPEQVAGMKKPMLVRVLEGDVDVRAAAIASNETGTLKMSALEQAKVDGERLGRVDLVAGAEGRLDIAENRGPIRRWVEQFPESERASLMDAQGNLSAEGSRRLQNAALHQAFGDSPLLARMVDSKDPGMGRVSSALLRSSGKIAEVRAAVSRGDLHDVDLGPDIVAAVERLAWLRDQGMTVEMYLRQGDLLGDGLSPEARRLLAFLGENMDSARRMADGLTRFYEAVEAAGDPKQADMFGESVAPDKAALLDQALADAEGDRSTAAAKMDAASPATREAALVTASSQMLEGKMPDVQALVDADPAIGQATFADIEATAKRMDEPQALRTADPVASQQVAERAASIPKAWGSETAKAERERVGAELQMLEAAQGDAWKYARAKVSGADALPDRLDIDGVQRPTRNSAGQPLARTEQGVRNFWKWFGDSKVVDEAGNPLVVYHGTDADFSVFDRSKAGNGPSKLGFWFADDKNFTEMFGSSPIASYLNAGRLKEITKSQWDSIRGKHARDGEWFAQWEKELTAQGFKGLRVKGGKDFLGKIEVRNPDIYAVFSPAQIKSATGNRGAFDPTNPDIRFSRGTDTPLQDPVLLREALATSFGTSTDAILRAGQVEIVGKVSDLPARADGGEHPIDVSAMTAPDGRVWIVAENASPSMARGLVLHEVGIHVGLEPMLGREGFDDVLAQVERLLESGDDVALLARSAVPEDTPSHLIREETLAYLVQHHPELPLVQRILAAVRAWAYKNFEFARDKMELTAADLQALAVSAVRRVARDAEARSAETRYSIESRRFSEDNRLSNLRPDGASWTAIKRENPSLRNVQSMDDKVTVYRATIGDGIRPDDFVAASKRTLENELQSVIERDGPGVKILSQEVRVRDLLMGNDATEFVYFPSAQNPDIRYSRGPIEVPNSKDELAPFREAEARADKYAEAVRAAAARWGSDVEMRAAIEKASGGEIVGREVEELIDSLKAKHREVVTGLRKMSAGSQAQDMAAGLQDAAMQAADMLAEAEVRAAAVEHRNAMLSLAARTRALSYVKANFVGREIEGLKALVAGTEFLREGGRSSAALEIKQFEGAWMGGIVNDLTKAGLWEHFARDAYAADVARALWQHSLPEPDFAGIHPDAKRIADVLTRYQSDARATQNRFGAWIGDLSGWMYRQAHDMHKMRKAGSAGWKDYVRTRLDWDRIREQLGVVDVEKFDPEAFLDAAWLDLSNGQHFKPDAITEIRASVGPSNIAKRVSQSRALHWKDADAAFGYLQAFGPGEGSLAETVLGGFHGSAKAAGLMKVFGPNYEANIKAVSDQLQQDLLGTKSGDSWLSQSKEVMDLLHHVDGSLSIPHKELLAKVGGGLRAWQSMAKLGAAVVSQISDVPVFAASIAHRFDVGLLPGLRDAMSGLLQGRSKGERLEILHECGYFYESLARQTFARFDPASDMPGAMSAAMEKFFKWGGITWWTETLRSTAVLTTARRLGDVHRKGFDTLPKATRDMLGLYKIDSGRWDLLRMGSTRAADGAVYMTAEGVRVIPDAAISSYLKASGRPVSDAAVANMRTDLEASMRSLFLDQSEYAVLEPSARSRQLLLRGTQAGTWEGEAFRMFAQFKSFPVVYAQKVFGREIQGRGYDTLGQYLRSGDTKAFGAMLGLMVSLTASGYLAGMAKDLLKLRSPKPVDDPRTWIAAFMQGGSLGIYGDFLFGNMSRFGTGAVETLAGPVPSALLGSKGLYSLLSDSVWGTVGKAVEGEDIEPADLGAQWLRYAENNTPFMNLHVLRPALNALLFWKLEEALNPGSLRRAEKRLQKETGSTMLVSPSEFVR